MSASGLVVFFKGDVLFEDVEHLVNSGMSADQAIGELPLGKYLIVQQQVTKRKETPKHPNEWWTPAALKPSTSRQQLARFDQLKPGMQLYAPGRSKSDAIVDVVLHRMDRDDHCAIIWQGEHVLFTRAEWAACLWHVNPA